MRRSRRDRGESASAVATAGSCSELQEQDSWKYLDSDGAMQVRGGQVGVSFVVFTRVEEECRKGSDVS